MATFLDISILSGFSSIFTFLFVFAIAFGMLEWFKLFGDDKRSLNAIISLCVALFVVFTPGVTKVIMTFTPWFTVLIIVIFLMIFAARMFGLSEGDVKQGFYNQPYMVWIIILSVIILLFSLGGAFGQESLEKGQGKNLTAPVYNEDGTPAEVGSTSTSSYNQNLYNTIFHPKVLGLVLILLIAVVSALLLTIKEGP